MKSSCLFSCPAALRPTSNTSGFFLATLPLVSVDACTHEEMLTCAARESEARPQLADDGTEGKRLVQRGEEVERERKRIREVSARQDIRCPIVATSDASHGFRL